ncbi:FAD:protein FMN transferase [Botrimarina sp.]|uniref:FAD:protein FMN transferase n=1 Tax=Botrimarina sp. TaxID=2795802 RepID=UPI0032EE2D08
MADLHHSRRDFLRGKAALSEAAGAIESAVDAVLGDPTPAARLAGGQSPETARAAWRVLTLTRRAMACDFALRLCVSRDQNDTAAGMAAMDLVERLEDQLTIYRDQSELIALNRRAAEDWVEVEPRLFALLETCDRLHRDTEGAFDPTGGPLSRVWGFHRREGRLPSPSEIDAARGLVGWNHVRLDPVRRAVRFELPGLEINVNSIGKGYALDRAGELLAGRGVTDWMMHGGRSTLLGRGRNLVAGINGWLAGIPNPVDPSQRLDVLTLEDQALSTSGAGTQFFEHEGRRYGHVIDPRTGQPAEGLWSASVVAPTAAEADALSTAAYVLGVEGTRRLCRRRPGATALMVGIDDGDARIVRVGG